MKTNPKLYPQKAGKNLCKLLFLVILLNSTFSFSQYQSPPGYDWKKVDWRPKDILNTPGLSQALSGDEWWYSHKNLYDNTGKHIGYVAVGYLADIMKPGDDAKMRRVFNEGTNSPYNLYPATGNLFTAPNYGTEFNCSDFVDDVALAIDTTGTATANERRTQFRGMVSRLDLQGNMIWCRLPNIHGDGLQELVIEGNYIYVVGTHTGAKKTNFNANINSTVDNRSFMAYNPSVANGTTNYFDKFTYPGLTNRPDPINGHDAPHIIVAKYDFDGNKIWDFIYGPNDFNATTISFPTYPNYAWMNGSTGWDIIFNTYDSKLYAVGLGSGGVYVAKIEPSNGHLINHAVLPVPNQFNSVNSPLTDLVGRSICQINSNGNMAIGATGSYASGPDAHHAYLYCITPGLTLNNNWGTNPIQFPYTSTVAKPSNVWEVNYHVAKDEILMGVVNNCLRCKNSEDNHGEGQIYRIEAATGNLSTVGTNPSLMGPVNAYDLRIGVIETSDGGFAAISSRSNSPQSVPKSDFGPYENCPAIKNYYGTASSKVHGVYDTDPLIVKFNALGNTQWVWSEDIIPGRTRQLPPGDFKRQECMYKLSEAWDGGLVASGNCSYNHDDDYLVKLHSRCNMEQVYDWDMPTMTFGTQVISTSYKIRGKVIINSGDVLTITGPGTKIRFADSKACGVPTYIEIKPGGKLILENGAELTSIDNAVCPGSMWDGISVLGNSSQGQGAWGVYSSIPNQGLLVVDNATISNARCAATTGLIGSTHSPGQTGGVIKATDAYFINNNRDIQIFNYTNPNYPFANKCNFTRCHFLTNNLLNNQTRPVFHMYMDNVMGVRLLGNEFAYNAGNAYEPSDRGWGIKSNDAAYIVNSDCSGSPCIQSQFSELTHGIEADNCNSLRNVKVYDAIFQTTFLYATVYTGGITFHSVNAPIISRCDFTSAEYNAYGISLNNCKNYSVNNNTLTSTVGSSGIGMFLSNSGSGLHKVYRNAFNSLDIGIAPQYGNSASDNNSGDPDDGLIMNCNVFSNNNYDIAMLGENTPGKIPSVRKRQGSSTTIASRLVRNQYSAGSVNTNQWYIDAGTKTIFHPSNSQTNTQPSPPFGSSLLQVITTNISLNFADDCLEDDNGIMVANNNVHSALSTALSSANQLYGTLKNDYLLALDGNKTQELLNTIADESLLVDNIRDAMLLYSPYLSDIVLEAYFSSERVSPDDIITVHDANKPVTQSVWQVIENQGLSSGEMATLTQQQEENPISARESMEAELGRARSEFQFIYSRKLGYFLTDTLVGAKDTVLNMLISNTGNLPDAKILRAKAYLHAGFFNRAYAYADSLSNVEGYDDIMDLQKVLLKLDTAREGVYRILTDADMRDFITSYAENTSKEGYWLARSVLSQVYGTDMRLEYLRPIGSGDRLFNPNSGSVKADETSSVITKPSKMQQETNEKGYLSIYPNPTANGFKLIYNSAIGKDVKYSVNDVLGNKIKSGFISPNIIHEFNTEYYTQGVYFITLLRDNKLVEKQKLIIIK